VRRTPCSLLTELGKERDMVAVAAVLEVSPEAEAGPADFGLAWHKVYASGVVGVRYRRLSAGADMTRSRYVE